MKEHKYNALGNAIRAKLRELNWNQSELSRATGLGRDSISTYINGTVHPTPKNLAKIANAFGCKPSDLSGGYAPSAILRNEDAVLEMTQMPNGKMRVRIIQDLDLEKAMQVFNILKK